MVMRTRAGPEIGVAATKTFVAQMVMLLRLGLELGRRRGALTEAAVRERLHELTHLPLRMERILEREGEIAELARRLWRAHHVLYLGRGVLYPIALEGALKLKELSYIPAEGCAAGEMKHGVNALLEERLPVVVLLPYDRREELGRVLYEKTFANLLEVRARGAPAPRISDDPAHRSLAKSTLTVPAGTHRVKNGIPLSESKRVEGAVPPSDPEARSP